MQEFLKVCNSRMRLKDTLLYRNFDESIETDLILPLFENLVKDEAVDVNVKLESGNTPLHVLSSCCVNYKINQEGKLINIVQLMIDRGADINAKNYHVGKTSLHDAFEKIVIYNCTSINNFIRLLIQKGGDVNAYSNDGSTPLHYLCDNYYTIGNDKEAIKQFEYLAELLIENGADINVKNKDGNTPFHNLLSGTRDVANNLEEIIQYFIHKGTDINAKNENGQSPFHHLLDFYHCNLDGIVQFLIREGADVNANDNDGKTPLHYLCIGNYRDEDNLMDIVQILIENGADINANDGEERTPLHLFCRYCKNDLDEFNNLNSQTTRLLNIFLEKGANINAKDKDGKTPLDTLRGKKTYDSRVFKVRTPPYRHTTRLPPSDHFDLDYYSFKDE